MQKDVKFADKKTKQNIKKNNNLRKNYARAILKATNSKAYKNLELVERLRKRKYRLKSNQPPFHTPLLGSSSNFKYKHIRNCAMNRVRKCPSRKAEEME